jgi:hypothetical protein
MKITTNMLIQICGVVIAVGNRGGVHSERYHGNSHGGLGKFPEVGRHAIWRPELSL